MGIGHRVQSILDDEPRSPELGRGRSCPLEGADSQDRRFDATDGFRQIAVGTLHVCAKRADEQSKRGVSIHRQNYGLRDAGKIVYTTEGDVAERYSAKAEDGAAWKFRTVCG